MAERENASQITRFLEAEYRAKVDIMIGQYGRILNRSNWFTGLEIGAFGATGVAIERLSDAKTIVLISVVGFLWSVLWLMTAIADRRLVEAYRDDVRSAYVRVLGNLLPPRSEAGELPEGVRGALAALEETIRQYRRGSDSPAVPAAGDVGNRGQFGFVPFSVTRMPIWAAGGSAVLWLAILIATIFAATFPDWFPDWLGAPPSEDAGSG